MKPTKFPLMNTFRHHGHKILIFSLLIFILTIITLFLSKNRQQKELARLAESITHLDQSYQSTLHSYHLVVDGYFSSTLNQPEVTELLGAAYMASSEKELNLARQRLYRHLLPFYEKARQQNLAQLQFHLPDGTSFLRFNHRNQYGDSLLSFRSMVRIANEKERVVYGFEVGKAAAGFRFIYPLYFRGQHVGSVEVVLSTQALRTALVGGIFHEVSYLLQRSLAESIFYPEELALCTDTELSPDFLKYESSNEHSVQSSFTIKGINKILAKDPDMKKDLLQGMPIAKTANYSRSEINLVIFYPIKDINDQLAGYVVAYGRDDLLPAYKHEFYTFLLVAIFSMGLVGFLLSRIRQQAQDLELERQSLLIMTNALAEGVYTINDLGIITRVNKAACVLLGYSTQEMLGQKAQDLLHNNKQHSNLSGDERTFFEHINHGYAYDGQEKFKTKDGHFIVVEVSGRPLFQDGFFIGSVVAFRDIRERERMEKALRASQEQERRLSAVVQQSPDPVLISDKNGYIEYLNPRFEELTGYSVHEVMGKRPPRVLAVDKISKKIHKNLRQMLREQKSWKGKLPIRCKNGTHFWAMVSISPIYDQAGIFTHHVSILEDITERLRMEESLRESELLQRTITESLPVGLVIIDAQTRIIEQVNSKAAQMFGAATNMIVGHRCHKFLCPAEENQCPIGDLGQTVDNSDRVLIRQDGTQLPILKTVTTITLQNQLKYLECFVDIVDRKAAEDALLEANHRLEQAIDRAEQLAHEAQAANAAKSAFLANMSHEIRTPMNAIMGMTHLALRTSLSPEQQDYLTKVDFAAKSLLGILNDILDFSKIEAGRIDLEQVEFSLSDVLENVVSVVAVLISNPKVELVLDVEHQVPEALIGDPLRLGQVLINLAGNAVKFTDLGQVRIKVRVGEIVDEDKICLHFQVQDTGIGMDEDQIALLFEPFEQAEASTTRQYGGTGLGLSISQRLVALMGGTLSASSTPNQGSTFSFQGIFGRGPELDPQVLPPALQGKKAVIFDDQPASRQVLLSMCQDLGLRAQEYSSLAEALEVVLLEDTDLVLISWYLDQTTALDVWQSIKEKNKPPQAILLVPAHQEQIMNQAAQASFERIITKPVVRRRLLKTIVTLLDHREADKLSAQPEPEVMFSSGQVLLVEDNVINQQVARTILEGAGLTVLIANDGVEAVHMAETENLNLILMDLQMPHMDGYEATRQIRSQPHLQNIPIVAMTAHATTSVRHKVLALGMRDCLTKPIELPKLWSILKNWLPLATTKAEPKDPSPEMSPITEDPPVLLVHEGLAHFLGNAEEYYQVLRNFLHSYQDSLKTFAQYLQNREFDEIKIFVHSLRGIAGNIGAQALYLAATDLEEHLLQDPEKVDPGFIDKFCAQIQRLLDEITYILPEKQKKSGALATPEQLIQILEILIPFLESRKPKGCKDTLKVLQSMSLTEELETEIDNLNYLIQTYDFGTAVHVVTNLRNNLNNMGKND